MNAREPLPAISQAEIERIAAQAEEQWRRRARPKWRTEKFSVTDQEGEPGEPHRRLLPP